MAAAWWVSHLELDWRDEAFRSFWRSTAAGHTLVRYDHPGTGMSDREVDPSAWTLDDEVALLGAVMDELGLGRASLVGGSSGGCAAIAFAARFPERVDRLLLYGTYAHGASIAPPDVREALTAAVRAHWGLGSRVLADVFVGAEDGEARRRFVRDQRASAQAETAAALLELAYRMDVRPLLEQVRAPTVVVPSPRRPGGPLRVWARPGRVHPGRAACQRRRGRSSSVGRRLDVRVAGARLVSYGYPGGRPRRGSAAVATRARGPHARRRRAERPRDRRTHRGQPSHRAPSRREHQAQTREWIRAAAVAEAVRLGLL